MFLTLMFVNVTNNFITMSQQWTGFGAVFLTNKTHFRENILN